MRERLAFWAKLPGRLARLGNRVSPDGHARIYGALHARIPMVTAEEQREIQEENAKADERFWGGVRDMTSATIEDHKGLITLTEKAIATQKSVVAEADENLEVAKSRLEKIRRGETVPGGLGKPVDIESVLKEAGCTPSDLRRARLLASLTKDEFKTLLAGLNTSKLIKQAKCARGSPDHPGAEIARRGDSAAVSFGVEAMLRR